MSKEERTIHERDNLIAAMMTGIHGDPPWSGFTRQLRDFFEAAHANVIFRHPALALNFITESYSQDFVRRDDPHERYDPADDPIAYYQMVPFRAYDVDEFLSGTAAADHPFLANFLCPLGMGSVAICRVVTEGGLQAWVSVARERDRPFRPIDHTELESIARLFTPALALFGQVREIANQRDAYARVVRARATGLVRLDHRGQVMLIDEPAAAWSRPGGALRIVGGRLQAAEPARRQELTEAVARIVEGRSEEEMVVLEAPDGEGLELLMFRTTDRFEPLWPSAPRVIVYMRARDHEPPPRPERLHAMFGLSRREAMLAALLVQGQTVAEAAVELGISEQTTRSYLRQVFEKTGVTRQAELVRIVQGSIASVQ